MHARVVVMRFLAVARMVLYLFPNISWQITLTCGRSTTCLAATPTRTAAFVLRDLLQHFINSGDGPDIQPFVLCWRLHIRSPLLIGIPNSEILVSNSHAIPNYGVVSRKINGLHTKLDCRFADMYALTFPPCWKRDRYKLLAERTPK
jgi:hypothetical protein